MQLRRPLIAAALAAAWGATGSVPAVAGPSWEDPTANSLLRVFTDSDRVSVRSVMGDYALALSRQGRLALHWNNERVRIPAIEAPVGSPEAVDAITTASRPISGNAYQDFVKVRNELQGAFTQGPMEVDYYYSTESDYLGQQLGARYNRDFMNQQLNLAFGTSYGWDAIQPLADDDTNAGHATKTTMHWNAVATRVLTPSSVLRMGVEYNIVDGLQHNPYRNVYAGGTIAPERHPDHRERRDVFMKLNQYLPNRSSLRFSYRLYGDDWGIVSHEADTKLSQYVNHGVVARYEYRYYTQTRANFYRDEYPTVNGIDGYMSGDYRMAYLASHLFGLNLRFDLQELAPATPWLNRTEWWMGVERYFNSNNYSANILETGVDFRF